MIIDIYCNDCHKITTDIHFISCDDMINLKDALCEYCNGNNIKRHWQTHNPYFDKESLIPKDHLYNIEFSYRDDHGKKHNVRFPQNEIDKYNIGK